MRENIILLPETDSTNTRLKALAAEGAPHGTVLTAARQTAGRGRMGRSFESPDHGLYLSILWRPECSAEHCLSLSPLASIAVRRAVLAQTGVALDIKWPNDLLLRGKKVCGILSEMSFSSGKPAVILGIGLNLNTRIDDLSPALRVTAGSLYSENGKCFDLPALRTELVGQLDSTYAQWEKNSCFFLEEYRAHCINIGRDVRIIREDESLEAFAEDVNYDFSLLVRYPDGSRENISFGEVSVR